MRGYGTVSMIERLADHEPKPSFRTPATMDPRTWTKDLTWFFMFLLVSTTIGPLLFGFHLAELNTPQDVLTCKKKSLFGDETLAPGLPQCIPMTPAEIGLVGSIYTLGGFMGALGGGLVSSRHGRLRAMHLTTIFFIVGPILEALAPNIAVLAAGRFVSGLGAGAAMVVVPIYVAEVSPPAERGLFGAFTQVMVNVGILIAQLLGFFLSRGQLWRVVLGAGGALGLVQTALLLFAVESPKWTATQGRAALARRDLQRIRGDRFDIDEEIDSWGVGGNAPLQEEEQTLLSGGEPTARGVKDESQSETLSMWQVVRHRDYSRAVLAIVMVMLAQQLTGINSVIMYGVNLLASVLASNSATLNLAVSALNIAVTAAAAPLVDRLGRKSCILASIAGMGISALLLAIAIAGSIKALAAAAVLCFVASFGVGLGPVPFILASELVGPEAVGATQSWALGANWIATFAVAQFFPVLNERLGGGRVYYIFTALAAFFFAFVAWRVPETKGKRDADEVWGRDRRAD